MEHHSTRLGLRHWLCSRGSFVVLALGFVFLLPVESPGALASFPVLGDIIGAQPACAQLPLADEPLCLDDPEDDECSIGSTVPHYCNDVTEEDLYAACDECTYYGERCRNGTADPGECGWFGELMYACLWCAMLGECFDLP